MNAVLKVIDRRDQYLLDAHAKIEQDYIEEERRRSAKAQQEQIERQERKERLKKDIEERFKLKAELEPDFENLRKFTQDLQLAHARLSVNHPIAVDYSKILSVRIDILVTDINNWIGE